MRGMGNVFRRKNTPYWHIRYHHDGREYRESSKSTQKSVATKLLRTRLAELSQGYVPAERIPFQELLDSVRKQYITKGGRSVRTFDAHTHPVQKAFATTLVVHLTEGRIERYITARQEAGRANATINRELTVLRQAFRIAQRRGIVRRVPYIPKLPEQNVRQGFWEPGEVRRFTAALPSDIADMVWFAYYTGWRKGEIAHVRWADVDMQARTILLPAAHTKTAHARLLALEGPLWALIERRYRSRGLLPWVFYRYGKPLAEIRRAWAAASKTTGIQKLFHDFRRTAVRNMIRAGVPERIAMEISGHKTRAIFDRYNIVSDADMRQALAQTYTYLHANPDVSRLAHEAK